MQPPDTPKPLPTPPPPIQMPPQPMSPPPLGAAPKLPSPPSTISLLSPTQMPEEPPTQTSMSPPMQAPQEPTLPLSREMPSPSTSPPLTPNEAIRPPEEAPISYSSREMSSPSAPPPPLTPTEAIRSPEEVPVSYPPPPNLTPSNVTTPIEWSTGLCAWTSDIPNCIITCFCPCITFGQISEIVDRGASSCTMNGVIYTLLVVVLGFACVYSTFYRKKMRQQFHLRGSTCEDCCIHSFCEICALTQEYRELQSRGFDMSLGWHGNIERQNQDATMIPPPHTSMRR